MPANVQLQDDTASPINSSNFGSVAGGNYQQKKFVASNVGSSDATGVVLAISRVSANDGLDFVAIAPDQAGNPGAYSSNPISVGTIPAGSTYVFWVRVTVPGGTTPQGNPRQFDINVTFNGT